MSQALDNDLTSIFLLMIHFAASMIAKIRITTEEEAKAALAERRRLAREQAEREAELERLRQVPSTNEFKIRPTWPLYICYLARDNFRRRRKRV